MNRFRLGMLGLVTAAGLLFAMQASALWVSEATIGRVRTYAGSDRIDIWFDVNVTSGCSRNSRVSVDSSYVTSVERRERILRTALSAHLSGRIVEVNTLSGCSNGNGRLDYLSLK